MSIHWAAVSSRTYSGPLGVILETPQSDPEMGSVGAAVVESIDVEPVNAKKRRTLYAKRIKVHPKRTKGAFRSTKWAVMAVTLGVYYISPWIRWDRGAFAPDQAILIDFPARRFYFFYIEIWPQEIYYVTGLLILAAFVLFLITSLVGRVWCGFTCPQTVWTDLFVTVERWIEGDRNARMRLDKAPMSLSKFHKRAIKHLTWMLISLATGGAWVFYFADAPLLFQQIWQFQAPSSAYLFIALFSSTTYLLGGFAREQVCTYMCPWPRIQGALFDEDSLLVSYRGYRGEPRGKHKKGESWDGRGDCVDCKQCVAVCPMGIDIRDGAQLECIHCALCVDACNQVMSKVGRPSYLIAHDTYRNLAAAAVGETAKLRLARPRIILYSALIVVVAGVMLIALITRDDLDLSVLHDRNPLFVTLSDGDIRNGYTLKLLNKQHHERRFVITVEGIQNYALSGVGLGDGTSLDVVVKPDRLRSIRVFLTVPRTYIKGADSLFHFVLIDPVDGSQSLAASTFRGPS
ncbi:MAG: cytochrome c oxidase accessory protein CcoG [Pseudomonadota bacterium]